MASTRFPGTDMRMNFLFSFIALILLASVLSLLPLRANVTEAAAQEVVSLTLSHQPEQVKPGADVVLTVKMKIEDGWHINAHEPLDEFLVPTEITLAENPAISVTGIEYPAPMMAKFAFSETELAVYEAEAVATVRLRVVAAPPSGDIDIRGKLQYQACNDNTCLPPAEIPFTYKIPVESSVTASGPHISAAQWEPAAAESEEETNQPIVVPELLFAQNRAYAGATMKAAVRLRIRPGWHINSNRPRDEFLIPTRIDLTTPEGVELRKLVYPRPVVRKFDFSEDSLAVYEGTADVGVLLEVSGDFAGSRIEISGEVTYQACNDVSCLAPQSVRFSGVIPVAGARDAITMLNPDVFDHIDFGESPAAESDNAIGGLIAEKGLALALVFIFLGGLALNLTPCVYPLIPITVSYFGGQASGSTAKSFALASIYVLGIAITYSALGVAAALSGSLFGSMLQNPIVLIFVAAVMATLATSMFGLWEIRVPSSLNQLAGGARAGYFGAFFMGLTVGIVAAPCIGPFVLALLTYVGTTGDPVLGFWLFFVLSMGLGLPYVVLGTFSGSISRLPKSGFWMIWVKKIFGFVLLAMAAYFLQPILPDMLATYLLPLVLFIGGLFVGFLDRTQVASSRFPAIKRVVGVAFVAIAVWLAWPQAKAEADGWLPYSEELLATAAAEHRPVIIDFSAEWCVACRELENITFPSEPVQRRADRFLLLRADLTQYGSPPVKELRRKFDIKGLPTVVFIGPDGAERKELRVVGFIPGEEFAKRMDAALDSGTN